MDARQQKGLEIAATMHLEKKPDGTWSVPSQSLKGRYAVDATAQHCTCPDFELRQQPCKHVFAVEYVIRRETVQTTDGDGATTVTTTETAAVRVTYKQDWPAYNAAQTTEKEHFCRLLHDLCANVSEPEAHHGPGRPRLPLRDMLFSGTFKVYSTISARRFMTDLRTACDAGFIGSTPHFNSVLNYLDNEDLTPIIKNLITQSSLPLRAIETDFAVDSTGFGLSKFFRYYSAKYHHDQIGRDWLKAHAMVGVKTNIVTAIEITDRDGHDSPQFTPLVEATARNFTLAEVSADKAYSGTGNLETVVGYGATPYIPFKSNARGDGKNELWNRLYHFFSFNREEFLPHYHKRSNVESTFSAIKRVFGDSVRSRNRAAQVNEILLKVLAHNIRCLIHAMYELNIIPVFERLICTNIGTAAQQMVPA